MDEKRKRVKQACDYCRGKKAKCDGKSPSCLTCLRSNIKCTYPQVKKRGLKTGYIQRLENKVFVLEAIMGSLVSRQGFEADVGSLLKEYKFLTCLHEFQETWENNGLSERVNDLINERISGDVVIKIEESANDWIGGSRQPEPGFLQPKKEDDWKPENLQFHGLTTLVSGFNPKDIQAFDSLTRKVSPFRVASIFHVKSDVNTNIPKHILIFPTDSRTSVDIYFQVVHPWLPMLNRIQVIRYIHRNAEINQKNLPFERDFNTMALTWTILANAQYIKEVTNQDLGSPGSTKRLNDLSRKYANNAIVSLEHAGTSTIETIQSMLLLGYFYYCIGEWDKAWVLTSSAARMAIDVRLMQPSEASTPMATSNSISSMSSSSSGSDDTQRRHRTWGVSIILNTLLSGRMGRSPVIRMSDWLEIKISEDGWEEWDVWSDYRDKHSDETLLSLESGRCLSTFNYLMSIVSVLNLAITSTIDTVGISDNLFLPNVITLEYLEEKLLALEASVPSHCRLSGVVAEEIKQVPPYIVFVDMAFHLVVCVICIRLSEVEDTEGYKYSRAKRDTMYSDSVGRLKTILTTLDSRQIIRIPYVDYMMTICLGIPGLLQRDMGDEIPNLLRHTSKILAPCAIVQSIVDPNYELQDPGSRGSSMSEDSMTQGDGSMPGSLERTIPGSMERGMDRNIPGMDRNMNDTRTVITNDGNGTIINSSIKERDTTTPVPSSLSNWAGDKPLAAPGISSSNIYKLFESKVSSPVPGVGQAGYVGNVDNYIADDLEAFMLDINMNADNRQDKFLKNLGFVGGVTPKEWGNK